ncbi:MAG: hypothetical protein CRN43_07105 [Candidatus Nephrothrix sp. EaCA]|nr:MAG: hypothetical protein CRN43_07105 [Candidatus Nephrothrix sp. EaCA]
MRILPQFAGGSSAGNEARVAKSLRAENIAQENINHRLTLYTPNKTDTKKMTNDYLEALHCMEKARDILKNKA